MPQMFKLAKDIIVNLYTYNCEFFKCEMSSDYFKKIHSLIIPQCAIRN